MEISQSDDFGFALSLETKERLQAFEGLVRKWNPTINLVSKESLAHLRARHILDSAQIFALSPVQSGIWCDLGSGGGFPGLVVAILASERAPGLEMKLVESDHRKSTFLREAARQLGLSVTVISERIESVPPLAAAVLSARALGPLPVLCQFAERHLAPSGVALFAKGARFESEVAEARKRWTFDLNVHQSKTNDDAAILEIRNIAHV